MTNSPESNPTPPVYGPVQMGDLTRSQLAAAELATYLTTPPEGLAAAQAPYYEVQDATPGREAFRPGSEAFSPATQAALRNNPDIIPQTIKGFMSPHARANLDKIVSTEPWMAEFDRKPASRQESQAKLPGVVAEHRLALAAIHRGLVASRQEADLVGDEPVGYAEAQARMRKAGYPNDPSIAPLRRGLSLDEPDTSRNIFSDDPSMPSANSIGRAIVHHDYQGDLGGGSPANALRIGGLTNRSPASPNNQA